MITLALNITLVLGFLFIGTVALGEAAMRMVKKGGDYY